MKSNRRRSEDLPAKAKYQAPQDGGSRAVGRDLGQESLGSPVKAVPVREVIELGKTRFNPISEEMLASQLFSAENSSPDFDDLPYETWDIKVYRRELRKAFDGLRQAETADEAAALLRDVVELWRKFRELHLISEQRAMEPGPDQAFYEEEYARAEQTDPLLEKSVLKLASAILSKPWLEELGTVLGKPFLLELNTHYTLYELGFRELRNDEKLLSERMIEQAVTFSPIAGSVKGLRQPDILLDDLLRLRKDLAERLGFADYRALAMAEQHYYDYDPEMLSELRSSIKRWLLPIHTQLQDRLRSRLKEGTSPYYEDISAYLESDSELNPRYERFADSVREYYDRIWGQDDWELRHIKELLPDEVFGDDEEKAPSCKLFILNESPEQFFRSITQVIDQTLPRQQRGFMQILGAKGYIRLNFKDPPEPLEAVSLYSSALPLIRGSYVNNSLLVSSFLQLAGRTYAGLLAARAETEYVPGFGVSEESLLFHGLGLELLALKHCHLLFGEQAGLYGKQRMYILLRSLLKACMIDEFEEAVYKQDELSMSDRLDLWRHLRENYGLEYYTHEVFWADGALLESLIERPFSSLIRKLPVLAALSIWDINRKSSKQARSFYENICRQGGADTFMKTLEEALLPDPFSIDSIKRLAYQLAYYLEQ